MEKVSKHDNLYKFIAIFLLPASLIWQWFFLFWMFYMLWYVYYYISTNDDRKDKRSWKKQEMLELAEETRRRRKEEEKEKLEQQKKHKEEEYKKYTDWRQKIEQMPMYERWKQDVIKKCENKCQICGSRENLEVHHIVSMYKIYRQINSPSTEAALNCKILWDIDNGIMLCKKCHDKMESSINREVNNVKK